MIDVHCYKENDTGSNKTILPLIAIFQHEIYKIHYGYKVNERKRKEERKPNLQSVNVVILITTVVKMNTKKQGDTSHISLNYLH